MAELTTNFFETHYYFTDDESHSMDAFVKNKCDRQILLVLNEIAKQLEIENQVSFEAYAIEEGSLLQKIGTLTAADFIALAGLIVASATLFFTVRPLNYKLDKEIKLLDIEQKKLEIRKLKKELEEQTSEGKTNKLKEISNETINQLYNVLENSIEIRKHLSKYYEELLGYNKVKKVGFSAYDETRNKIIGEKIIERDEFRYFLLADEDFTEIDEKARIHIFSPNLVQGRHKWRGYYDKLDKTIEFSMNDRDFKKDVESGVMAFKNGSMIDAVLLTNIKIDASGVEKRRTYTVETVLAKSDGEKFTETKQGKEFKSAKKIKENQLALDLDESKS